MIQYNLFQNKIEYEYVYNDLTIYDIIYEYMYIRIFMHLFYLGCRACVDTYGGSSLSVCGCITPVMAS